MDQATIDALLSGDDAALLLAVAAHRDTDPSIKPIVDAYIDQRAGSLEMA